MDLGQHKHMNTACIITREAAKNGNKKATNFKFVFSFNWAKKVHPIENGQK
jgi:hypothetical protein